MEPIMKVVAWTFVHSLWQGLVAAILAAIIISGTRKTSARLRYNLLGIVLILFLSATLITFLEISGRPDGIAAFITATGPDTLADSSPVLTGGLTTELTNWINSNSGLLLLIWGLFFLLGILKLFTGLAAVNRLRHYKVHPVSNEWKARFEELSNTLGIRQSITLLQSELVKVPVALGYLKPVILLPIGLITQLPAAQLESILLHELGHIRRKDYLVNFLQRFTESVFFFNPGMLWVSALLRQEREACCDDIVMANSQEKKEYMNALVAFQEYSMSRTPFAMAITSRRYYLLDRLKRLTTHTNKGLNLFEKSILVSGIFIFSAFAYVSQENQGPEEQQFKQAFYSPATGTEVNLIRSNTVLHNDVSNTDTTPPRKSRKKVSAPVNKKEKLPVKENINSAKSSDEVLKEIIEMKDQIGAKKEIIGEKKALLLKAEGKEKEKIQGEIDKMRGEIEGKRGLLDKKRAQREKLMEQEQEKKQRPVKQTEIKKDTRINIIKPGIAKDPVMTKAKKDQTSKLNFALVLKKNHQLQLDQQIKKDNLGKPGPQIKKNNGSDVDLQVKKPEPTKKAEDPKIRKTPESPKAKGSPPVKVRI
jgi:beta-lactamase regulating signal transducer with metallopeptidase domain